ncbi:NAD(P)-binding protein [Calocera cornea HHB12733]|uniref:NAD(P)-binding protein n=1 Tax=Calocera cornea HHB12733 TaxID=1353952 RepID=A0A165I814_9BASI|nr:NAD(P)-binding protein [Calocera cornea HHB12733]
MPAKIWFITGAATGFGRLICELVLEGGDICIATSIDPPALEDLLQQYGDERMRSLSMDVTKPDQIQAAFAVAEREFGHIDIVYNNAGIALGGELEGVSEESARKLFDINFWGATNVTKEAVRFFREVNGPGRGGKLVQVSSGAGIGGVANLTYYCASKHALEGMTKALVQELSPDWNIQVMLVEPGYFRTSILAPQIAVDSHPAYKGGAAEGMRQYLRTSDNIGDPKKGIELIHRIAQLEKLPLHLPVGLDAVNGIRSEAAVLKKAAHEWESSSQGLTVAKVQEK